MPGAPGHRVTTGGWERVAARVMVAAVTLAGGRGRGWWAGAAIAGTEPVAVAASTAVPATATLSIRRRDGYVAAARSTRRVSTSTPAALEPAPRASSAPSSRWKKPARNARS